MHLLVTVLLVDEVDGDLLPLDKIGHVVGEEADAVVQEVRREIGVVRRQKDVLQAPQRALGRQRLLAEHVQSGPSAEPRGIVSMYFVGQGCFR